jgi:uncharacterized protein (TIGR00266 family)
MVSASKVDGQESQIVVITLGPMQMIRAETGNLIYMTDGVEMETSAGSVSSGFKRMLTGQNFFVSDFSYRREEGFGEIALGAEFPSKILKLSVEDHGGRIICQKGAFLAGSHTIDIEMEFTKSFGVGFFGGEGFVLQKLTGSGTAFVKAGGALIERDLKPGEQLRVSPGSIVGFEGSVDYDIQMIKGFKNVLFGGEGFILATLTGPGRVYLQGLPFDRMVDQIARRIPGGGGGGFIFVPGMGGGSSEAAAAGAASGASSDAVGANAAGGIGMSGQSVDFGSQDSIGLEGSRDSQDNDFGSSPDRGFGLDDQDQDGDSGFNGSGENGSTSTWGSIWSVITGSDD